MLICCYKNTFLTHSAFPHCTWGTDSNTSPLWFYSIMQQRYLIIIIIIVSDNVNDCAALIMKHFIKRPAWNSKYFCAIWNGTPGGYFKRSHDGSFSVGGWNSCQGLHVLFSTGVGSWPKRAAEGVVWQCDVILWALHCAGTVVVAAVVLHCWPRCLFSITPLVAVVLLNSQKWIELNTVFYMREPFSFLLFSSQGGVYIFFLFLVFVLRILN